ncbi:hypothetical protein D6745_02870 [Candidatus Woesearchaeota archaeon]|nr:MAG: hypothetical protein D6745_02870 [Candidatus Woesearchaeota archaeon]
MLLIVLIVFAGCGKITGQVVLDKQCYKQAEMSNYDSSSGKLTTETILAPMKISCSSVDDCKQYFYEQGAEEGKTKAEVDEYLAKNPRIMRSVTCK